jgi:hypothetical protein
MMMMAMKVIAMILSFIALCLFIYSFFSLHDQESGFIVIIDRRQDGWGAVKSILLKMSVRNNIMFCGRGKGIDN